ncbi:MAG: MotE family protein [Bdellovibrionales bacterium]
MSYDKFFKATREVRKGGGNPKSASFNLKMDQKNEEERLRERVKMRPRRRRVSFPIVPMLFLAAISTLLGWWSVDPELPDRILGKVNVQMFSSALASGEEKSAKSAQAKGNTAAKAAATQEAANPDGKIAEAGQVAEDLSHLQKLRERKESLDLREKELGELEEELQKQKAEIGSRIKQLEELRTQITAMLKDRVEVDQEKVMKLVETYSNMKPKQAADILAGIDEDLAVEVLGKMKKKNAAEIMNLLEPAKARAISEKYAGYKAR